MVNDTYCTKSKLLQKQKDMRKCPDVHKRAKLIHMMHCQDDQVNLAQQQQNVCACHYSLNLLQFLNSRGLFLLNREVFDTHKITNFADNLQIWYTIYFYNVHCNQYNN
jgi:hypothetical protein